MDDTVYSTQPPMLPFDIIEYITSFLHDDHATLCALSLVSAICRPATRFHLFYRLKFLRSPSSEYHKPLGSVKKTYQDLDKFLGQTPDVAANVRHLVLHRAELAHPAWSAAQSIVVSIVQRLSRVKKISFWNTSWHCLSPLLREALGTIMSQPDFVGLEFSYCTFQHHRDMLNMLRLAPGLKQLGLGKVEFRDVDEKTREVALWEECIPSHISEDVQPAYIEVLHLDCKPASRLVQTLLQNPPTLSFERLHHVSLSRHGDLYAGARLLASMGGALVSLDISHGFSTDAIDISLTPNLRIIRFHEVQARFPDPVPRILSHLRKVKEPHILEEIYLDLSPYDAEWTQPDLWTAWSCFAERLNETVFPDLQKVAFSACQGGPRSCDPLIDACNALRERGILWINGGRIGLKDSPSPSSESDGEFASAHESDDSLHLLPGEKLIAVGEELPVGSVVKPSTLTRRSSFKFRSFIHRVLIRSGVTLKKVTTTTEIENNSISMVVHDHI